MRFSDYACTTTCAWIILRYAHVLIVLVIFDEVIHIQYAKICIIMNFNRKSIDTKNTIFLVLVVALVVNYSLKLLDICF